MRSEELGVKSEVRKHGGLQDATITDNAIDNCSLITVNCSRRSFA